MRSLTHRHAQDIAKIWILQLLPLDAQAREPGVLIVPLVIRDEVVDYRGGDDEADVLRILVLE